MATNPERTGMGMGMGILDGEPSSPLKQKKNGGTTNLECAGIGMSKKGERTGMGVGKGMGKGDGKHPRP